MAPRLRLFEAVGIELEYMIVDRETLRPRPIAERVLVDADGDVADDIQLGPIGASNELAAHVLELKTGRPVVDLARLEADFHEAIAEVNRRLRPHGAQLAPGGMHPFMDPATESAIWPHGNREIYETYDRIFNCRGHGWFNLQSCHLNLPFFGDAEFARLHYAIILLLPYLPALAASSPYIEGKRDGMLDARLRVYQTNQQRVPQIAGDIVPEALGSRADYEAQILEKTYAAIAPFDPQEILQEEWLNSRGAIARFDRNAIEIRILDTQECPAMDLAIVALVTATLKRLASCGLPALERLARAAPPAVRKAELMRVATLGPAATIELPQIAEALGLDASVRDAGDLWTSMLDQLEASGEIRYGADNLRWLLQRGPLASRLVERCGDAPTLPELAAALSELSACLAANRPFDPVRVARPAGA